MKILCLMFAVASVAAAQVPAEHKSIHQIESEAYALDAPSFAKPSTLEPFLPTVERVAALSKKVLGWHPYWVSATAYLSYDYAALSHLAYFSYETDTATGSYISVHSWRTDPAISYAQAHGAKVLLTVTNFGAAANAAVLGDTTKQKRMIDSLVSLLKLRNGDGVNFDLESVGSGQRASLVAFIQRVRKAFNARLPGAEISMASPAVDWSNVWDFAGLSAACDYLVMMGYDYYWSGSTNAGPVSPMASEFYNVMKSIHTYLNASVPPQKLWLGVPWYGYDFFCVDSSRESPRFKSYSAKSRTLDVAESMVKPYGKRFDVATKVPWFFYGPDSCYHHVWYDDSLSLSVKYDSVNALGLGGIGIWALTYNGTRTSIWNGIRRSFAVTDVRERAAVPGRFALLQNYPNPFNPATTIAYELAAPADVLLRVFDLLGREVAVLDAGLRSGGRHVVSWNAGLRASGVYVYQLRTGAAATTRTMLLLK
jgi:spore germination protein YaaH